MQLRCTESTLAMHTIHLSKIDARTVSSFPSPISAGVVSSCAEVMHASKGSVRSFVRIPQAEVCCAGPSPNSDRENSEPEESKMSKPFTLWPEKRTAKG
jgi:hypothetical protein